jgi:electron transfer flavoprotein-quinone oxidoreductase
MSEEKFDAIIVGSGVAGAVAGYVLATAGLQVLIIERGNFGGAKNMTGGRLYSHSLEKIIPNFAQEAPVERKVIREKVSMMTPDSAVTMEYLSAKLGEQGKDSYTVCRSEFDRWLADKAEAAGALMASGIRVDDLIVRGGQICGVICGEEKMEAAVVVLADGVNSLLAQKIGLKNELLPHQVAVGVKEVIELPAKVIEERFNLAPTEGMSWLFCGSVTDGCIGGGFLYTNKETVSLGLVCSLSEIDHTDKTIPEMLDDFKQHPIVRPLIEGGRLAEYSAHLVPEAGYNMLPSLYKDGVVIIGDAAGFVLNTGYMVRGMDLAITSAEAAAQAIIAANKKGDYSADSLSLYKKILDESYVMKDLALYRKFPTFMENKRIFNDYPRMMTDLMAEMFVVDGAPAKPVLSKALKHMRKVGLMTLAKDGWKGVRSL